MSGIEVLRELKSIVELGKIPVHVISDLEEDDVSQIIAYLLNYSARHPERIMIVGGMQSGRVPSKSRLKKEI